MHPTLEARDFVSRADLPIPIVPQVLLLRFDTRLLDLELAVLNPGGDMDRVLARLKDLEDRQSRKSVTMGWVFFQGRPSGAVLNHDAWGRQNIPISRRLQGAVGGVWG